MAVVPFLFDTGPAVLPDLGELSYNGIRFSSLFKSRQSGGILPDEAKWTTRFVEWALYVEGIVTQNDFDEDTGPILDILREKLTQHGAELRYHDRGFGDFIVNPDGGGGTRDVAWGPVPKLLEFTPLGEGRSAMVRWQVTVHYSEVPFEGLSTQRKNPPVIQFNWDYRLHYDEEGYSSYRLSGTLEVPLSRSSVDSRKITATVEDYRKRWLDIPVDASRFRVTDRSADYSRDRRTVHFNFAYDELPPMGLPPGCTGARGTFSVRNSGSLKGGGGGKISMSMWICSLRATYTVRGDQDQRVAFLAFYALLWYRMQQSKFGQIPKLASNKAKDQQVSVRDLVLRIVRQAAQGAGAAIKIPANAGENSVALWDAIFSGMRPANLPGVSIVLTDFGYDEGLYLDSKTVTFQASWWMSTTLQSILEATGFKRWWPGIAGRGNVYWQQSMQGVLGYKSWLENGPNKNADIIVDLGGGGPFGAEN